MFYLLKIQRSRDPETGNVTETRGVYPFESIDNALAKMPERLTAVKTQLDNLYKQQEAAKVELGKPFPFEKELASKTARLVELDTQLHLGGHTPPLPEPVAVPAKQVRPSILERLKQPLPQKPAQKRKSHSLEESL